jgi:hypothetical protein
MEMLMRNREWLYRRGWEQEPRRLSMDQSAS